MTKPIAVCVVLGSILRIYPKDKRLTVHIPAKDLARTDRAVEIGAEVTVVDRSDSWNNPTMKVSGRVKRLVYEVEIDLATLDESQHEGQATLT